jgi:hypothetical protein
MKELGLDLENELAFRDLKESEHWAFVQDYDRTTNAWLFSKPLHPSVAIKEIEDEHMNACVQLKNILKKGGFSLHVMVSTWEVGPEGILDPLLM